MYLTETKLDIYNECFFLEAEITFKPRVFGMEEAKEIKRELQEIKRITDMTDEELYKNRNTVWKFCLHLLQFNFDLAMINCFIATVLMPPIGIIALIINRLLRQLTDKAEIKNELKNIDKMISSLKRELPHAGKAEKEKIQSAIKRLEKIERRYK